MQILTPIPETAPTPKKQIKKQENGVWVSYDIINFWIYKDLSGKPLFYTCKYLDSTGKKNIPCQSLWKDEEGNLKWLFKRPPLDKFPMYHQDIAIEYPDASIVIVEGEKCAELAQAVYSESGQHKIIFLSWLGGDKNVHLSDVSILNKRKVFFWADNDDVGRMAMNNIANMIQYPGELYMLRSPDDKPQGWDVADYILDEHATCAEIYKYIKDHAESFVQIPKEDHNQNAQNENHFDFDIPLNTEELEEVADQILAPFKPLGVNDGKIYFQLKETQEITAIPARRICHRDELITLAPVNYWEQNYPGKTEANYLAAGDHLLRLARSIGILDQTQLRGRGVWFEGDKCVIHYGNKLSVDGRAVSIFEHKSDYTYVVRPRIEVISCEPLRNSEAIKYRELNQLLNWTKPAYALFQSGWAVTASVCGAWSWRPNIWVSAEHGAGKSYNMQSIVSPIIGKFGVSFVGRTTEAGIRQYLGCDSLAVLFDETEGENKTGQERIQSILELIRQSANEDEAITVKGSSGGDAIIYHIRSMFMLSSIGVNLTKSADISRITLLHMKKNKTQNAREQFEIIDNTQRTLLTKEYCERMRERIRRLIPVIKSNYEVFRKVIAEKTGAQRIGDQAGMLLSGAYALSSTNNVDLEFARNWVSEQDWAQQEFQIEHDGVECLNRIIEYQVAFTNNVAITVFTLIDDAVQNKSDGQRTLNTMGITVRDGKVWFAVKHSVLGKKILGGTAWENCYDIILERFNGAARDRIYFSGIRKLAIGIPQEYIFNS